MTCREIENLLEKRMGKRHTNKVLHCHPSPLFWSTREIPIRDILSRRRTELIKIPKKLNVYIATPFCLPTRPESCGYCLFPHARYKGIHDVRRYLDSFQKEGELYREFLSSDRLAAIYFGGGTPNIYPTHLYPLLMERVRKVLPDFSTGVEITMEGNPALFSREKLLLLKDLGFNRISLGVQQMDDELIKLSGRRQTARQVQQVLDWCHELGLRTSADLIFGWPGQTRETLLKDLSLLVETGIGHLTFYELNLGGKTDFARNRKHQLPSIEQNLDLFHRGREFLGSRGFSQVTTYDFEKRRDDASVFFAFEDNMRRFFSFREGQGITGTDMWGWGFAGVNYFIGTPEHPGCVYMNASALERYHDRLWEGHFPIERAYLYETEDVRLGWLFQRLQGLEIDLQEHEAIFHRDLNTDFEPLWQVLAARGWITRSQDKITLKGDGIFFTPLIQSLLSEERNQELRLLSREASRDGAADGA